MDSDSCCHLPYLCQFSHISPSSDKSITPTLHNSTIFVKSRFLSLSFSTARFSLVSPGFEFCLCLVSAVVFSKSQAYFCSNDSSDDDGHPQGACVRSGCRFLRKPRAFEQDGVLLHQQTPRWIQCTRCDKAKASCHENHHKGVQLSETHISNQHMEHSDHKKNKTVQLLKPHPWVKAWMCTAGLSTFHLRLRFEQHHLWSDGCWPPDRSETWAPPVISRFPGGTPKTQLSGLSFIKVIVVDFAVPHLDNFGALQQLNIGSHRQKSFSTIFGFLSSGQKQTVQLKLSHSGWCNCT